LSGIRLDISGVADLWTFSSSDQSAVIDIPKNEKPTDKNSAAGSFHRSTSRISLFIPASSAYLTSAHFETTGAFAVSSKDASERTAEALRC